jgi:cyclohexa-1,5-dienecarbonyl-CoA hydratase
MSSYEFIRCWDADGAAWISLNRPPLNVINLAVMAELDRAVRAVKAREGQLRALVFTAEGERAFSAGVEVADHTPDKAESMLDGIHGVFRHIETLEIPVIAAVKGAVLGGGLELVLLCDLVVAAENAKLGQPEIKVGVLPPLAAVVLPRVIPAKRAFELILGGESIRAGEALALGLANRVFPLASFDEDVAQFLRTFTALSGSVLRATKRALRAARGLPFPEALSQVEVLYLSELMSTEDAQEGLAAFVEKRRPVWTHR